MIAPVRPVLLLALAGGPGCTAFDDVAGPPLPATAGPMALRGVTVFNPGEPPRSGQTILTDGLTITAVGPDSSIAVPADVTVVNAPGRWVMPGLIDMHVHDYTASRETFLGHGIVRVRVMWGSPADLQEAGRVAAGEVPGPVADVASPGHDAPPASWPLTRFVTTEAAARAAVTAVKHEGWAFLKVYDRISPAVLRALGDAARDQGVRLVGHVPFAVPLFDAIDAGMESVEHLTGFWGALPSSGAAWSREPNAAALATLAQRLAATGVASTPTLAVQAVIARQDLSSSAAGMAIRSRRAAVQALHLAGARLLIGSDAGIGLVDPGRGLLEELDEFHEAGIPADDILRIATAGAADFLGAGDTWGRIGVGYRAALLVLESDPRELSALRRPAAVLHQGRLIDAATLAAWREGRSP